MSLFVVREFLNQKGVHYPSYIQGTVHADSYEDKAFSYGLEISDCNKKIYLNSTDSIENSLYKLNTLIESITKLRDSYIEFNKYFDKIIKKYKTEEEVLQLLEELKEKDFFAHLVDKAKINKETYRKKTRYYLDFEKNF